MSRKQKCFIKSVCNVSNIFICLIVGISVLSLSYLQYLFIMYPTWTLEVDEEGIEELPHTGTDDYRVFITSQTYSGNLGGIDAADSECNRLAGSGEWRAFLSSSTIDAFSRVKASSYYLYDCSSLVIDWSNGITQGPLNANITKDENGQDLLDRNIWTGIWQTSIYTCDNWLSSSSLAGGEFGTNADVNRWYDDGLGTCNVFNHLYCFEIQKDRDNDSYNEDVDCDDNDATVYPTAPELCDGKDNNCDGVIPSDEVDNDGDGYRICSPVYGDCDDNDPNRYPGAYERCNGVDDNCDYTLPDDELDRDSDGYRGCDGDCNDRDASINPSVPEVCDARDNDCDGKVDEDITRECSTNTGICTRGIERCINGVWGNCNGVKPQLEVCDGLDNDCDSQIDEGCSCDSGTTQPCGSDVGICSIGTQWCEDGRWGDCHGNISPRLEICDGRDNDCDGQTDESLSRSCGSDIGTCKQGIQYCQNGTWAECTGGVGPDDEKCDGEDNNCDGTIDEGCTCTSGDERECGVVIGECEKGTQRCVDGTWGECEGASVPSEEVCDGVDNDCDGEIDEGYICEEEEAEEMEKEEEEVSLALDETVQESKNILSEFKEKLVNARVFLIISFILSVSMLLGTFGYYQYKRWRKEKNIEDFKKAESFTKKETKQSPLG